MSCKRLRSPSLAPLLLATLLVLPAATALAAPVEPGLHPAGTFTTLWQRLVTWVSPAPAGARDLRAAPGALRPRLEPRSAPRAPRPFATERTLHGVRGEEGYKTDPAG